MTVTSFSCDSCGANVPLSELVKITECPFCNKNFYINADWEESVRVATKKTETIMVDTIRDINIPEVQDKILQKDLETFRRVNESLAYLEITETKLNDELNNNVKKIQEIENTVGFNYDGLSEDIPQVIEWKKNKKHVFYIYLVCGVVAGIVQSFKESVYSFGTAGVMTTIIVCLFSWPFLLFVGELIAGLASYAVFATVLAGVPWYQRAKQQQFIDGLDDKKRILDIERIDTRKRLQKENIRLSLDIDLLSRTALEIKNLSTSASILNKTTQFDRLSAIDIVKKIDFAAKRMQTVPIEFEVACSGFKSNSINVNLPFPKYIYQSNIELLIQKALEHIKN